MFFWIIIIEKSADSNVLLWSEPLLSVPRAGYIFERDLSKVKSMQIKDVRLVGGLDSITHPFVHTSVHF